MCLDKISKGEYKLPDKRIADNETALRRNKFIREFRFSMRGKQTNKQTKKKGEKDIQPLSRQLSLNRIAGLFYFEHTKVFQKFLAISDDSLASST